VIARPGGFLFSELAPAHPPLAHSIYASGLVNIFAYATELAPTNPPLAFAVTPPGWLDYALTRISNARPGGFLFYVGRPFVVAGGKAGKMPALHGLSGLNVRYFSGSSDRSARNKIWSICLTGRW
jgi:hypothetical protein